MAAAIIEEETKIVFGEEEDLCLSNTSEDCNSGQKCSSSVGTGSQAAKKRFDVNFAELSR